MMRIASVQKVLRIGLVVVACMAAGVGSFSNVVATSTDGDWMSSSLYTDIQDASPHWSGARNSCVHRQLEVAGDAGQQDLCVYQSKSFEWAYYQRKEWVDLRIYITIKFPLDQKMHIVEGIVDPNNLISMDTMLSSPDTDDFVDTFRGGAKIIKDLPSHITQIADNGRFSLDDGARHDLALDDNGDRQNIVQGMISSNGRWLVIHFMHGGIVRVDLETYAMKLLTRYSHDILSNPYFSMAISNDGTMVALTGTQYPPMLLQVRDGCGEDSQTFSSTWLETGYTLAHECPGRNIIYTIVNAFAGYQTGFDRAPRFSDDGTELDLGVGLGKMMRISPSKFPEHQLDYLALGDSYSSGEGDIELGLDGKKHYLPRTDDGNDNCHISSRSYPFLLRDKWGIDPATMKSVACSGAKLLPDINGNPMNYTGETQRLLSDKDMNAKQSAALETFMPGYVPQLEFVKKYNPRVITLTAGGNDVGFADVMTYCAFGNPIVTRTQQEFWTSLSEGVIYGALPCAFAVPGNEASDALKSAIQSQYQYTTNFLNKIHTLSPGTQVYVLGYPQLIDPSPGNCHLAALELDNLEKVAINAYVTLLNDELINAVSDTGYARYIDIEHSLSGGELCGGDEYMTGAYHLIGDPSTITDRQAEIFHPNAKGHQEMAKVIEKQIQDPPQASPTVNIDRPTRGAAQVNLTQDDFNAGEDITLQLPANSLQPESAVKVTIYSDPTDLGTLVAATDGSLWKEIQIPSDLPDGFHFLTVSGKTFSGEDVTYYQFVTVGLEQAIKKQALDGDQAPETQDGNDVRPSLQTEPQNGSISIPMGDRDLRTILTHPPLSSTSTVLKNTDAIKDRQIFTQPHRNTLFVVASILFIIVVVIIMYRLYLKHNHDR